MVNGAGGVATPNRPTYAHRVDKLVRVCLLFLRNDFRCSDTRLDRRLIKRMSLSVQQKFCSKTFATISSTCSQNWLSFEFDTVLVWNILNFFIWIVYLQIILTIINMTVSQILKCVLFLLLSTTCTIAYVCNNTEPVSDNPVIGIVALELWTRQDMTNYSYIAASYVKYLESAGAQVVPLPLDQPDQYYLDLYDQLNGVLFPGGGVYFNDSDYTRVCNLFFEKALQDHGLHEQDQQKSRVDQRKSKAHLNDQVDRRNSNDFPIWGTCLGMEMLAYLAANFTSLTFRCRNQDAQTSLNFTMTDDQLRSQTSLFHGITDDQLKVNFTKKNDIASTTAIWFSTHWLIWFLVSPFHTTPTIRSILKPFHKSNNTISYQSQCLAPELFEDPSPISDLFHALATGRDSLNQTFVSIFEGRTMPIYGTQFHPEKPLFEFVWRSEQRNIPHTQRAIQVGQHLANEFVHKTRQNRHCFNSRDDLQQLLIYNYNAEFVGSDTSRYEQIYRFPLNRPDLLEWRG